MNAICIVHPTLRLSHIISPRRRLRLREVKWITHQGHIAGEGARGVDPGLSCSGVCPLQLADGGESKLRQGPGEKSLGVGHGADGVYFLFPSSGTRLCQQALISKKLNDYA